MHTFRLTQHAKLGRRLQWQPSWTECSWTTSWRLVTKRMPGRSKPYGVDCSLRVRHHKAGNIYWFIIINPSGCLFEGLWRGHCGSSVIALRTDERRLFWSCRISARWCIGCLHSRELSTSNITNGLVIMNSDSDSQFVFGSPGHWWGEWSRCLKRTP